MLRWIFTRIIGFILPNLISNFLKSEKTSEKINKINVQIKIIDKNLKLKNITLVPYDLDLINWSLITNFERKYIKQYHNKIYQSFESRLNNYHKNYFIKNLINKI